MKQLTHQQILAIESYLLSIKGQSLAHCSDIQHQNENNLLKQSNQNIKFHSSLNAFNIHIIKQSSNDNLKGLIIIILRIIFEKHGHKTLLTKFKQYIYNNFISSAIIKKPNIQFDGIGVKKILAQFFQMMNYGSYDNKVIIKLNKYPILIEFFVLYMRTLLISENASQFHNYEVKIITKYAYERILKYFQIEYQLVENCYLFKEHHIFIQQTKQQTIIIGDYEPKERLVTLKFNDFQLDSCESQKEFTSFDQSMEINPQQQQKRSIETSLQNMFKSPYFNIKQTPTQKQQCTLQSSKHEIQHPGSVPQMAISFNCNEQQLEYSFNPFKGQVKSSKIITHKHEIFSNKPIKQSKIIKQERAKQIHKKPFQYNHKELNQPIGNKQNKQNVTSEKWLPYKYNFQKNQTKKLKTQKSVNTSTQNIIKFADKRSFCLDSQIKKQSKCHILNIKSALVQKLHRNDKIKFEKHYHPSAKNQFHQEQKLGLPLSNSSYYKKRNKSEYQQIITAQNKQNQNDLLAHSTHPVYTTMNQSLSQQPSQLDFPNFSKIRRVSITYYSPEQFQQHLNKSTHKVDKYSPNIHSFYGNGNKCSMLETTSNNNSSKISSQSTSLMSSMKKSNFPMNSNHKPIGYN